jgi:hypothetical protein
MRVKSDAPKSVDKDRRRYYKARADRVEMENAERRKNLIPAKETQLHLRALAAAISGKIRASSLEPTLQAKLFDELADLPHRLSLNGRNGKSNVKARSTRRGQKRNAHQTNEEC